MAARPRASRASTRSSRVDAPGRRGRVLARQASVELLFAESAAVLEDAAGVLLHAATAFVSVDGSLPGLFAEQAGALLTVAARFEEAADLARGGEGGRERV